MVTPRDRVYVQGFGSLIFEVIARTPDMVLVRSIDGLHEGWYPKNQTSAKGPM